MTCRCGVDVHAHVVPENFPSYLPQPDLPGWPAMAAAHACHRHVMIDGKTYRTVSDKCWDAARRVADMEEMGLSLQAISPMPELFSYWLPTEPATALIRYTNDQIAEMIAQSGGKLTGLGGVPLQDMDAAIAELHRLRTELGFAGVEIGSNINGTPIGAVEFEPFFAEAEKLGAAVFVHAVRPAGMNRVIGPGPLQQAIGYPTEIGLAAASVLTTNLMERFPALRIAFSHGGGTLGLILPRLEQARQVFPALREAIHTSPAAQARRLFYDALVFDAPTLRHLVGLFGDTQVMIGTDYPFNFHDHTPVARIEAAIADPAARARLITGNARRFLGLEAET
jgi:aminocarboxymuconate-semialdehyde decarboxylase